VPEKNTVKCAQTGCNCPAAEGKHCGNYCVSAPVVKIPVVPDEESPPLTAAEAGTDSEVEKVPRCVTAERRARHRGA